MLDDATLTAFYRIFQGNPSFFVTHQPPFTEDVEGKVKAGWCGFAKYGTKSFPKIPEGKEDGDLVPLTKERYKEHLNGGSGLAIASLCQTKDKKFACYFAAIDIDIHTNFTYIINKLYTTGLKFVPCQSKSGGLHIYFFFRDAELSDKVVATLNRIVDLFGLKILYCNDKKKSKVEIFPKQTTVVPGLKNANCLFLPFYNTSGKCKNKMITGEGKLIGITKAIPLIENMFTSLKEIDTVLDSLPYSDAPYCVQAILLTGILAENDGRNCFLFSAALYCKKKYGENFYSELEEMNNCLEAPLEEKEIKSIYKSVTEKSYDTYSCKKSPCLDYCDKKLCKLREYGVGRDRNNQFTGMDCWGELTKVMAAGGQEPYFLWEVRVKEEDEFKTIRVDSLADLQNQVVLQRCCWRDLNWSPLPVSPKVWVGIVNKAMEGIDGRKIVVPKETDTTEMAMLHESFLRFLTHKQIQKDTPYLIKVGQVYHAHGAYFFITRAFVDFLVTEKRSIGRLNLRETLKEWGCEEGKVTYTNPKGTDIEILCWTIKETEEILAMDAFYEDIYEGDADIIEKSKPRKEEETEDGDDTKF